MYIYVCVCIIAYYRIYGKLYYSYLFTQCFCFLILYMYVYVHAYV